jgi:hypothetical protein
MKNRLMKNVVGVLLVTAFCIGSFSSYAEGVNAGFSIDFSDGLKTSDGKGGVEDFKIEGPVEVTTDALNAVSGFASPSKSSFKGVPKNDSFVSMAVNVINFFLGFVGAIAIITIVYGAFRVITDGGEGDGVAVGRRSITGAVIGIVVVFLSYVIVDTIINISGLERDLRSKQAYVFYQNEVSISGKVLAGKAGVIEVSRDTGIVKIPGIGDDAAVGIYGDTLIFECKRTLLATNSLKVKGSGNELKVSCMTNKVKVWYENK